MRIVKAGPVAATLEQVDALRLRVEDSGVDAIREAMSAWGFVAEVDPGEIPEPYMISYASDTFGEQGAYLFAPHGEGYSFFIHGYRTGTPILLDEEELAVPPSIPLPQTFRDRYVPPSAHENPSMVVPPPRHPLYACPKCGGRKPLFGMVRGAETALLSLFDWESVVLSFVSCASCDYTEFYRTDLEVLKARMLPDDY